MFIGSTSSDFLNSLSVFNIDKNAQSNTNCEIKAVFHKGISTTKKGSQHYQKHED